MTVTLLRSSGRYLLSRKTPEKIPASSLVELNMGLGTHEAGKENLCPEPNIPPTASGPAKQVPVSSPDPCHLFTTHRCVCTIFAQLVETLHWKELDHHHCMGISSFCTLLFAFSLISQSI